MISYFYNKRGFWRNLFQAFYMLPLFLSISMGLALHNAQAVFEGFSGKKSPFIRTPKFNLESGNSPLSTNLYRNFRIPLTTWFEGILAVVFATMVFLSFKENNFILLPFHLMLAFGYGTVFLTSFKSNGSGQ
jgi:hypothetical protein